VQWTIHKEPAVGDGSPRLVGARPQIGPGDEIGGPVMAVDPNVVDAAPTGFGHRRSEN
jgi:hypothetical protein